LETIILKQGIKLHILPDSKFKNFRAGVYMSTPLTRETAAKNAFVARIMRSGTKSFPDKRSINMRLEELYGASLFTGVEKMGERHVVKLWIDALADRYIENESILQSVFDLLEEALLHPVFDSAEREKQALIDEIRATVNDKRKYALTRCVEEMCKSEPYGTPTYGREEDVLKLDGKIACEYHGRLINTAPIDIFVIGAFDKAAVLDECTKLSEKLCAREEKYADTCQKAAPEQVNYVTDRENVTQGKLVIGYRVPADCDNVYPLMVYNAVFGGGTSSKLFNNVREKLSLCYYASSIFYRKKGLIMVQAGIDFDKYQKTFDEIVVQSEDIKAGRISDEEFGGAVLGIVNALRSYKDDLGQLMSYYSAQIGEDITDIDEKIEKILSVKMEQIIQVARQISMDTVYFLSGNGTESDNEG